MAIQEQNEGTGSNTTSAASFNEHSGSVSAFADESTVKVRKPYTITKQREKWTDEEHQRFLEALKLYGRGWRQIEEHIGTKTAVQIRSHAQKFFSKVSREPNSGGAEKPIDIPPPRPKRKPVHPYPRKSVDARKGASVTIQEIPAFQKPPASENGRRSPSSVLSAGGSDALGSVVTEQLGRSNSPQSCTTDMQLKSTTPVEKENDCMTSDHKSKGSFEFLRLSLSSDMENQFTKKFKDASSTNGEDVIKATPFKNFKLFGATLPVADCREKSGKGNNISLSLNLGQKDFNIDNSSPAQTAASGGYNTNLFNRMADNNSNAGGPVVHCIETEGSSNHSGGVCASIIPLLALQQGLTFFCPRGYNTSAQAQSSSKAGKNITEADDGKDISCTGSNSASVGDVDVADSRSKQQICFQEKSSTLKSRKGFVPYKRCLSERDTGSSKIDLDEPNRQRLRVCL